MNNNLDEKAVSKQQRKLFGIARAVQKGDMPASKASPEARKIAKDVSTKEVRKFAGTPEKHLPKYKGQGYGESDLTAEELVQKLLEDEVEEGTPAGTQE